MITAGKVSETLVLDGIKWGKMCIRDRSLVSWARINPPGSSKTTANKISTTFIFRYWIILNIFRHHELLLIRLQKQKIGLIRFVSILPDLLPILHTSYYLQQLIIIPEILITFEERSPLQRFSLFHSIITPTENICQKPSDRNRPPDSPYTYTRNLSLIHIQMCIRDRSRTS